MDAQTTGLITLLRNALTESSDILPEGFDWDAFSNELDQYKNLRGLLIRGATLAGIPRSHPVIKQLMIGFLEDIRRSRNQMQQLQAVYAAFDAQGVDYMPVKGAVIKTMYPQPEMRMMEDADILIRTEQLPAIRNIMLSMGMEERPGADNEYTWNHPKLLLELHKSLMADELGEYSRYLKSGWSSAIKEAEGNAYRMKEEDHFIFLVIHFAKHYMRGNISPKDICDLWVFRGAYPRMDEAYIEAELKKVRLADFYHNILAVLDSWFCRAEAVPAVDLMTEAVFQHGLADYKTCQWNHDLLSHRSETDSMILSKLRFAVEKLFPPLTAMRFSYPILMKWPWLMPVFWLVRWFQFLFKKRGTDRAVDVLLHEDTLHDYAEHLHAVGLSPERTK